MCLKSYIGNITQLDVLIKTLTFHYITKLNMLITILQIFIWDSENLVVILYYVY